MEFDPFAPSSRPEKPATSSESDKDEKDPKKRKKRVRLGVPVAKVEGGESKEKDGAEPKPRSLAEELAESLLKEKPAAKEPAEEADKQPKKDAEATEEVAAEPEASETDAEAAEDETYEALPTQEKHENELGAGEFVLQLNGNEPIAERIISLRGEAPAEELPVDNQQEVDVPLPIFAQQAEQPVAVTPEVPAAEQVLEAVPVAPEMAAGGGGEVPPTLPPEAPSPLPPEEPEPQPARPIQAPIEVLQPYQPVETDGSITLSNVAAAMPAGERPATKQEVEDALHRSAQIHEQRGVLSGLLFGSYLANRRLRRRQLRESRELDRQSRQLEQLTHQSHAAELAADRRQISHEQRFTNLEKQYENPAMAEKTALAKTAERAVVPAAELPEPLKVPEDHRLETSAWHTIEVDSRTGKAVEAPTFQYGHEYYRERAQEATPALERNAAAGEVALVAAAAGQAGQPPASMLPNIPDASTQGPPPSPARQKDQSASGSATSPGLIWPWAVALVVIIICLVIVLH